MAGKDSEFTKTEIKAGALVLSSAAVFIVFFAAVLGWKPASDTKTYFVRFMDTGGLNPGADVRFGGKMVGEVVGVELAPESQSQIEVELMVSGDTPVNADSEAYITQVTLTSENHVEITTGADAAAPLPSGATLPSTAGGLFGEVENVASGLTGVLEDVQILLGVRQPGETLPAAAPDPSAPVSDDPSAPPADGAGLVVDKDTTSVADIFRNVDGAVISANELVRDVRGVVGENQQDIREIVSKVKEVETAAQDLVAQLNDLVAENRPGVKSSVDALKKVSTDAERMSTDLANRFDALATALQNTLDSASQASGDVKSILEDNRPVIEDTILDLRETVRHLKEFTHTIKEQPQSVVRGPKEQGRKAE